MLKVPFFYCYAECHYTECRYAECRGADLTGHLLASSDGRVVEPSPHHLKVEGSCPTITGDTSR
jgi:hypothetical protein